jgi:hypothetical protein
MDPDLKDVELDDDEVPGDVQPEDAPEEYSLDETGFDLDDEYKEDPLAPAGSYNGIVKNVDFAPKLNAIVWTVVAVNNPGMVMQDGETPLDGMEFDCMNWLPKPGEENIRSGKSNKRQNKINMLKRFQDDMEVDMNTPQKVRDAIEEGEWIGISVVFKLAVSTYEGRTRNQINGMKRAEEDFELPEDEPPF